MVKIHSTCLEGVKVLEPQVFRDNRGFFYESYRASFEDLGIDQMMQMNVSRSSKGVLRGLHFQRSRPQSKLISVTRGIVYDVAVDIRLGSPTFGKWHAKTLSDKDNLQIYIPIGYAHGFCVISKEADVLYQCSDYYEPGSEVGIRWDDPVIGIPWPISSPIVSSKDLSNPHLMELPKDWLPSYLAEGAL